MTSLLKTARERFGMTIEDVAQELKIRRQYLMDLEEGRVGEIPGEVYAQGYLKMYASYLGVDSSKCPLSNETEEPSGFWARGPERIANYSRHKVIISLFLMGILCIFCWYSLNDKVIPDSEPGMLSRLSQHDASAETDKSAAMDHHLVEAALGHLPIPENE